MTAVCFCGTCVSKAALRRAGPASMVRAPPHPVHGTIRKIAKKSTPRSSFQRTLPIRAASPLSAVGLVQSPSAILFDFHFKPGRCEDAGFDGAISVVFAVCQALVVPRFPLGVTVNHEVHSG